jgi:hypothetical protein
MIFHLENEMKLEYTPDEFKSIMSIYDRVLDLVELKIKLDHKNRVKHRRVIADDVEWGLDDDLSEEESSTAESPLQVHSGGKKVKQEDDIDTRKYIKQGEASFNQLVEYWMINFDAEGDQPDRADAIRKLRDSYDGRAILHYLNDLNGQRLGLTTAVFKSGWAPNHQVRLLAENMAQVSSALHFYQIAHFLEYPDPTQMEDFFNV